MYSLVGRSPPPVSTKRDIDIAHVISILRPPPSPSILAYCKFVKNRTVGRPGNNASPGNAKSGPKSAALGTMLALATPRVNHSQLR